MSNSDFTSLDLTNMGTQRYVCKRFPREISQQKHITKEILKLKLGEEIIF